MPFRTLDDLDVRGKRVLVRADLNVPMADGKVTDTLRIVRQAPTIRELAEKGARVIVLSHFDRPVAFADDCIGPVAQAAVATLKDGQVLLLENTRFHSGEEENDPAMAKQLAAL